MFLELIFGSRAFFQVDDGAANPTPAEFCEIVNSARSSVQEQIDAGVIAFLSEYLTVPVEPDASKCCAQLLSLRAVRFPIYLPPILLFYVILYGDDIIVRDQDRVTV